MLHQGLAFKGFSIEASDGKLGTVSDFLFDDQTWKLRWLVIQTGNWLTDRKVLLHPSAIEKADLPNRTLLVNVSRDQVEKSPGIATDEPVSMQTEYRLCGYYGMPALQGGMYEGGTAIAMPMAFPNQDDTGDPHLRSLAAVIGYRIHASDGAMGHLENVLIDDEGWNIRYLVANTRDWWFGRHVLLSPASVREILWQQQELRLNLTGYKIKGSPHWEPTGLLDRAYEHLLQAHYGWPATFLPPQHAAAPAPPSNAPVHEKVAS
jgi:hypothetical protein